MKILQRKECEDTYLVKIYYPLYAVHRSDIFKLIWKDADNVVSDWGLVGIPLLLKFNLWKNENIELFL